MKRGTILKGMVWVWKRFLRVMRIILKKERFGKIKVAFVVFTCYIVICKSFEFYQNSYLLKYFYLLSNTCPSFSV